MEGLQSKRALRQQIPIEGLDMSDVENNAMALGDRPVVESFVANDPEQLVRSFSRLRQARVQVVTDADRAAKNSHAVASPRFDAASA
jgi:hypothetical protein